MKILLTTIALSGALCAQNVEVHSIQDVRQEMLESCNKNGNLPFVIKLPKGSEVPVSLLIKGDFFAASSEGDEAFSVKILKDLYVKTDKGDLLVSQNGRKWKPVAEFFTGSLGWSINDNASSKVGLFLEANKR